MTANMQIDDFITHQSIDGMFIVTGLSSDGEIECAYIDEVDEYDETCIEVINENDYINYGRIKVCKSKELLTSPLTELILVNEEDCHQYSQAEADGLWDSFVLTNTKDSNKYMYVLIKN